MTKQEIKDRIALSNKAVANGLPADPWVIEFRVKNNSTKAAWKARQPKTEHKKKGANITSFKKGSPPHNKKSQEERAASLAKWRQGTREWHKINKDRINERRKQRRAESPGFRIQCNLRKRLSFLLRLHLEKKSAQTMVLLGCDIPFFMNHLQALFSEGMSFQNYGEWHLDHIVPCDSFDLTDASQQAICFLYSNIQPLWGIDNRIKSNKILDKRSSVS